MRTTNLVSIHLNDRIDDFAVGYNDLTRLAFNQDATVIVVSAEYGDGSSSDVAYPLSGVLKVEVVYLPEPTPTPSVEALTLVEDQLDDYQPQRDRAA